MLKRHGRRATNRQDGVVRVMLSRNNVASNFACTCSCDHVSCRGVHFGLVFGRLAALERLFALYEILVPLIATDRR